MRRTSRKRRRVSVGGTRRIMTPLLENTRRRMAFYGGVVILLLGSVGLIAARLVEVKMLPFDNKSEFQVILDLPEGTSLEASHAAALDIAGYLRTIPEVQSVQTYAGTSGPVQTSTGWCATTSCGGAETSRISR